MINTRNIKSKPHVTMMYSKFLSIQNFYVYVKHVDCRDQTSIVHVLT